MPLAREKNKNDLKRIEIRQDFWPAATDWIWDPTSQKLKGFAGVSRLMPWVTSLIRSLSTSGDPSSVYWEFWCRHMSQGIVEIGDEEECAFAAGYSSKRALRTWFEHVYTLQILRFIDFKAVGNRKVGYVLLPNPLAVARWYHDQGKTPSGWWPSFKARAREIGAEMPGSIDISAISAVKPPPPEQVSCSVQQVADISEPKV